jgi:hypothetical protein
MSLFKEGDRMSRSPRIARWILSAAAAVMAAGTATAGLLPTQVTVTPDGGNFRWTYAIVLPTDMRLQSGNSFTIYDFAGYVPGTAAGPDGSWSVSAQNVSMADPLLNPIDNPTLPNLVFTYNGPTIPSGQLGLGNFVAFSTYSDRTAVSFTAQTNRTSDGLQDNNITTTDAPTGLVIDNPPGVPEPATLLLAGLGLPLVGAARRLRKKK